MDLEPRSPAPTQRNVLATMLFALATACGSDGSGADDPTVEADTRGDDDDSSATADSTVDDGFPSGDSESGEADPAGSACEPGVGDCPEGFKCAPVQADALVPSPQCVPVPEDPIPLGAACPLSDDFLNGDGTDPCDADSVCVSLAGDPREGKCLELCGGTGDTCEQDGFVCIVAYGGNFRACHPECDPLGDDCGEGGGCYLNIAGQVFICGPTFPGASGHGHLCDEIDNLCVDGHTCAPGVDAAGCEGEWCCTPYCDMDGRARCPAAGESCVAPWPSGSPPPGTENVGICVVE